ncbi:MAG: nodulation protein NfeD [Acidobacteriota bacterium]
MQRPMSMRTIFGLLLLFLPLMPPAHAYENIISIEVYDAIHPVTAEFISDAIDRADETGASLLIIKLDTPGGLLEPTKSIVQKFYQSKTPVAVFVHPSGARATSAGFMLLIASDIAVMAPGTNTGAAHPVLTLFGKNEKDDIMITKAESDAAAFVRTIAENRGRNIAEAERAVKESVSFTEKEALEKKLIDLIYKSQEELIAGLNGKEIRRFDGRKQILHLEGKAAETFEMNWRQRFLSIVSQPIVSYFLLLIGILGIYVEITHPGVVFPGVVGVIALLLFAFTTQIIPVNYIGILLILFSIVLFILEIKISSYGMLTIGGVMCIIIGSMILFEGPIPELRLPLIIILPTSFVVVALMVVVVRLIVKAHRREATGGVEGLLHEIGSATTDIEPNGEGKVFIHGEYWNASSKEKILKGEKIRVSAVKDMNIEVEKVRR